MNVQVPNRSKAYAINVEDLQGRVTVWRGKVCLASSTRAKVMYETRLPATLYFPKDDVLVPLGELTELQTFCPFKGTAGYRDIRVGAETVQNGVWAYDEALPESAAIEGHVGFMPPAYTRVDLGSNVLREADDGHVTGPLVDWLLRDAASIGTPEDFVRNLAERLQDSGIAISRLSILVWSLHPLIAGRHYIWEKGKDEISTFSPSYDIYDHPSFRNSPLRHVSEGLGGVRHRIGEDNPENRFPIIEDLRAQGATDYVAMPMQFSDGRINVLTLTSDHPDGFSTADLGLIFECSSMIGRFFEVFTQRENAQTLLETYVGKRTGARVLGGDIRRGDGDDIDAAIMFCDLRNSSLMEEQMGRSAYIEKLNRFFETVSEIIHDGGGEVLKFIGDAVLAVFPAEEDSHAARCNALNSATRIVTRLQELRASEPEFDCDCVIGLAYGQVTYGNVGSLERLDFTVIGQAANIAARLGDHGKENGHNIVVSQDILAACDQMIPLGELKLHNVTRAVRSYAVDAFATRVSGDDSAAASEPARPDQVI